MRFPAPDKIRVVLADDHELVRSGIRTLLASLPGVEVVAEAGDGDELLQVLGSAAVDVVLTDLTMPGMDGISAIARIRAQHPALRILVLSMHDSGELVRRAIEAGASGYLTKDAPDFELDLALRSVMATGRYFSPGLTQRLLARPQPAAQEELTPRQLEILILLAQGNATKEIGFRLGLSGRTVDVHRARIMERLGLYDIASLTRYALRKGLVKP